MKVYLRPVISPICLLFFLTVTSLPADLFAEETPWNLAKSLSLPSPFAVDGAVRTRLEYVDWFNAGKQDIDNQDSYYTVKSQVGLSYKKDQFKFYLQGQHNQVLDLSQSSDSGPGSIYRNFNQGESNPQNVYIRQAHMQYSPTEGDGLSLLAGRFLYHSGAEVKSVNKTLAWLKSNRIMDRMIGTFDFTFGRSFDGMQLGYSDKEIGALTMHVSHPTEGGFNTDGMKTITDITLATTAFTREYNYDHDNTGELQFFYYLYQDQRNITLTDNRDLTIRQADLKDLLINNFGAHWLHTAKVGSGTWDGLLWGVLQEGQWGENHHLAQAFAAETGYRFDDLYGTPWLRAGLNWGSGDKDPNDGSHNTFFEMLPTVRIYAMTPFYNQMNSQDIFLQGIWKPFETVTFRSDVHFLNLVQSHDLLYSGAGAGSRNGAFGYAGASSNNTGDVGTLLDGNIWVELNKHVGLYFYYGYLLGGDLPKGSFAKNRDIQYGFVELNLKL